MTGSPAPVHRGTVIPAGLQHDRRSAVLMRDGRASRLSPTANTCITALLAHGGEARQADVSSDARIAGKRMRFELRRLEAEFAWVGLRVVFVGRRMMHLRDLHAPVLRQEAPLPADDTTSTIPRAA